MIEHISNRCDILTDTTVYPYEHVKRKFVGGFSKEQLVENARMPGLAGPRDLPVNQSMSPSKHFSGRYLFAGPMWNHFGHVLVDCLHRIWPLTEAPSAFDGLVFSNVVNLRPGATIAIPPFVPQLLEMMGIPSIPIILVDEPTSFDELFIPQLGSVFQTGYKPFYKRYLQKYQENITKSVGLLRQKAPKRIFYGRNHALRDGGVIGSSYFENVLADVGFISCVPEEMSLRLQFSYIMNASDIIFEEGSAIHLTDVLLNVPAKIRMLPRRSGDKVFSPALINRTPYFENLASDDNIFRLKDRNGNISPASLTLYRRPDLVHRQIAKCFQIAKFDMNLYEKMEDLDHKRSPAKDSVREERANAIKAIRDENRYYF